MRINPEKMVQIGRKLRPVSCQQKMTTNKQTYKFTGLINVLGELAIRQVTKNIRQVPHTRTAQMLSKLNYQPLLTSTVNVD